MQNLFLIVYEVFSRKETSATCWKYGLIKITMLCIRPPGFIHPLIASLCPVNSLLQCPCSYQSWIFFCCLDIPHLLYRITGWWTFSSFHILALWLMWHEIWKYISFWYAIFISIGCIPISGSAGSYGRPVLNFWGISITLPVAAEPHLRIPTHRAQAFSYCRVLSNTCALPYPYYCHSNRCELMHHCGFNLHFPDDSWFEYKENQTGRITDETSRGEDQERSWKAASPQRGAARRPLPKAASAPPRALSSGRGAAGPTRGEGRPRRPSVGAAPQARGTDGRRLLRKAVWRC